MSFRAQRGIWSCIAFLAAMLTLDACAALRRGGPAIEQEDVSVVVHNQSFPDVVMYIVPSGDPRRIGMVTRFGPYAILIGAIGLILILSRFAEIPRSRQKVKVAPESRARSSRRRFLGVHLRTCGRVVVVHDGPTGLWISRRNGARVNVLTRGVLRVPLRVVAVRVLPGIASGPSPEEASGSPSVVSRRPQKSGAGRRVAAPGPRSDEGDATR